MTKLIKFIVRWFIYRVLDAVLLVVSRRLLARLKPDASNQQDYRGAGKAVFRNKDDADELLEHVKLKLEDLGHFTVGDLYTFLGKGDQVRFTDDKWGWTNLDLKLATVYEGDDIRWFIRFPQPVPVG